jgi:hypothetical protein
MGANSSSMSELEITPSAPSAAAKPIMFVHSKDPQFRCYHADGSWIIPNGHANLNVYFFVEHPKMAESVICEVTPDGKAFTGKTQVVGAAEQDQNHFLVTRDMQCNVVLSPVAARILRDQLEQFLNPQQPK